MANDCIFCKIGKGEIQGDVLDHDDRLFLLRDINPQAPVHLLIIPFEHVETVADVSPGSDLVARMAAMANAAASKEGLAGRGYRLVINTGHEGAQSVDHLHMHVLGGRLLSGQMG